MAEYFIQDTTLDAIANAINAKTGGSSAMTPAEMVTEIGSIETGGGIDNGIELTLNEAGYITKAKIIGEIVPPRLLCYGFYDNPNGVLINLTGVTKIGFSAFNSSNRCIIDFASCADLEVVGNSAFRFYVSSTNSMAEQTALFPKWTGINSGDSIFQNVLNNFMPKAWSFPVMSRIPPFIFYGMSVTNVEMSFGSVGHAVNTGSDRPFGGSANATGTITIYTTGSLLDTIKTSIQNGAGSGLQFIYKASEATEYGGVSYAAGDTMLTVGGA